MANDAYVDAIRLKVIQTIRNLCDEVHDGRWYVRRGPINWAAFDFDKEPFAMALLIDEGSFLRPTNTMQVSIEIFMKLKSEEEMREKNISDTGLDDVVKDICLICARLEESTIPPIQAMMSQGHDAVVLAIDKETDKIVELSDLEQGLQGLWATFAVSY